MNKFCLITVIWGTICITIVGGCGVKTIDTKNVNQEMEKSKKEPALDKKSAKEETINPPIQLDMHTSTIGIAPYAAHKSKE